MGNQLTRLAKELLTIEEDIPFRVDFVDRLKPPVDLFDMYNFKQVWGSTALGFGGVGGQALTEANTYVFVPRIKGQRAHVYFGDRYAYSIPEEGLGVGSPMWQDIQDKNMEPVYRKEKYFKKEEEQE